MKFEYSKDDIYQGRGNQEAAAETPGNFGKLDSAPIPRPSRDLATQNTRMAGKQGARALALMNNPQEKARVEGWMFTFNNPRFPVGQNGRNATCINEG